jgi:pentose-5-phosphate-3-epimerase
MNKTLKKVALREGVIEGACIIGAIALLRKAFVYNGHIGIVKAMSVACGSSGKDMMEEWDEKIEYLKNEED